MNNTELCMLIALLLLTSFLGFSVGYGVSRDNQRENAIEAKVAEYYLDEDNNKQFKYLTGEEK